MKVKEIAEQISKGILASFQKHGFKFLKKQNEFIRKTEQGHQVFQLFYYKKEGYITIDPEIRIHIHEIESIYKSIAQIIYRPYLTLGNHFLTIRDYDGDAAHYKSKPTKKWLIENDEDVQHLI